MATATLELMVEKESTVLQTPKELMQEYPLTETAAQTVSDARQDIQNILDKKDPRLLIVTGPCSIHNPQEALEYAQKVKQLSEEVKDKALLVMRAYFEKPRTQLGWKGALYDPDMNDTYNIQKGHEQARELLLQINELGVPTATEFLGLLTPQYYEDLISYSAIGARTVESQPHREMTSGLSMPVGLKNNTEGSIVSAINAIKSAQGKHNFVTGNSERNYAIVQTNGNPYAHIILRGGEKPNHDPESIKQTEELLEKNQLPKSIIIDCSHANSNKDYTKQPEVFNSTIRQRKTNPNIVGVMLESNLQPGNQKIPQDLSQLQYGVSITDACIGWKTTEKLIKEF